MVSYKEQQSLSEFIHKEPGVNLPVLAESPEIPRDVFYDLQRSNVELCQQVTALQVRNKELESYAYMLAHDLKDPLNVMVMASELINDIPDLSPQELQECLRQISSVAFGMDRIINNLLLFAEVSRAKVPLETLDMTEVVANVRNRLCTMIKKHQAQIVIPEVWPDAIGYGPWIEEVWANYLSNALKHGGQSPRIELGASSQLDDMVRFWTRDNGPGLPPDAQTCLFTPFSQIGRVGKLGHGLGLSIAYHIVEKLGGEVGVESELGKGSLFFFTLPAGPLSP
jgi:two-component system, sensor histidine kinase and response regulator